MKGYYIVPQDGVYAVFCGAYWIGIVRPRADGVTEWHSRGEALPRRGIAKNPESAAERCVRAYLAR